MVSAKIDHRAFNNKGVGLGGGGGTLSVLAEVKAGLTHVYEDGAHCKD